MIYTLRDRSTISKFNFIFGHAAILIFTVSVFNMYVLIPIEGLMPNELITLLIECMVIPFSISALVTFNAKRSFKGILTDTVIGLAIFFLILYKDFFFSLALALLPFQLGCIIVIANCLLTFSCVFTFPIDPEENVSTVLSRRMVNAFCKIRTNLAWLAICPIFAGITLTFDYVAPYINNSSVVRDNSNDSYSNQKTYDESYSFINNIDSILRIKDNKPFSALSYNEKKDLAKDIINAQLFELGVSHVVNFKVTDSGPTNNTIAYYSDMDRTIYYVSKYFTKDNNESFLKTLSHEVFHVYQYELARMYNSLSPEEQELSIFSRYDIPLWTYELNNYKYVDEEKNITYADYYEQDLEQTANAYSEVISAGYLLDTQIYAGEKVSRKK